MSDYTYEAKTNDSPLETYEWDNNWLERCNTDAPRILYIGDSISCATRKSLNRQAAGKLLFDGFGTSKALDNPYFATSVKLWGAQQPGGRKFVLFNNGLHGWHLDDGEYAAAYDSFVEFLTTEFSDSQTVILLTTHVRDASRDERVVRRNREVLAIAERRGLPTVDLYSITKSNPELLSPDGVHLLPEGYELLAEAILKVLYGEEN